MDNTTSTTSVLNEEKEEVGELSSFTYEMKCGRCGAIDKEFLRCSFCKIVCYCNQKCQKEDWKSHKRVFHPYSPWLTSVKTMKDVEINILFLSDRVGKLMKTTPQHDKSIYVNDERIFKMRYCYLYPMPIKEEGGGGKSLYIGDSKIHGKGVFTSEPITQKGKVLTFYPVDGIWVNQVLEVDTNSANVFKQGRFDLNNYTMNVLPTQTDNRDIAVVGNPENVLNPLSLGHMINDGCINIFENVLVDNLKDYYYFASLCFKYWDMDSPTISTRVNCEWIHDKSSTLIAVISKRAIEKGEELLASYGIGYWLRYNYGSNYYQHSPFISEYLERSLKAYKELK